MCGLVDKVVIVWNNLDVEPPSIPPQDHDEVNCNIPVVVHRSTRNSLNNRFNSAVPYVASPAVLAIDEDLLLSRAYLACLVCKWRANQDRIVGPHPRFVTPTTGDYKTDGHVRATHKYNVVLTSCALFASRFLKTYMNEKKAQGKVDAMMNGEDILLNAAVQNVTKIPPLYVSAPQHGIENLPGGDDSSALHTRTSWGNWVKERTELGQWALQHYGNDVFRTSSEFTIC